MPEDQDAALFLDAMSRIRPLPGKGKAERGRHTLAESLAAKMKNGQGPELFSVPDGDKPRDGRRVAKSASRQRGMAAVAGDAAAPANGPHFSSDSISQAGTRDEESFAAMLEAIDREKAELEPSREDLSLFARAMKDVVPVNSRGRQVTASPAGGGAAVSVDPVKALRDVLEGRVEFALHHTDEFMEGFVVGVDPLVLSRLRNGQYSPEGHVDLHGMNSRQAYDALVFFIKNAYQRGLRTVVVVTGRGRNSPDGIGVLRGMLQRWLCRDPFKRVVLAFCTARPGDGGPGAVYVLLRKYKKSRGKIIWEHTPSDDDFPDV